MSHMHKRLPLFREDRHEPRIQEQKQGDGRAHPRNMKRLCLQHQERTGHRAASAPAVGPVAPRRPASPGAAGGDRTRACCVLALPVTNRMHGQGAGRRPLDIEDPTWVALKRGGFGVRASEGRCVVGGAAPTPYTMRHPGPGRCTIREEVDGRFGVKWTTRLQRLSSRVRVADILHAMY
jgi:hypothetical protein